MTRNGLGRRCICLRNGSLWGPCITLPMPPFPSWQLWEEKKIITWAATEAAKRITTSCSIATDHPLLRPTTPKPVTWPAPALPLAGVGRSAFWLVDWPIGDKPVRVTSDGFPTAPGATHASYIGAPQSSSSMSTSKSPAFKAAKTLWLTSDLDSETSIKHHRLPWLHLFTIPGTQWLRVAVNVGGE